MHARFLILVGVFILTAVSIAHGDIYQWEDERGVVHFTDNPDKIPARFKASAQRRETQEEVRPLSSPQAREPQPPPPPPATKSVGGSSPDERFIQVWKERFVALRLAIVKETRLLEEKREALKRAHHDYRVSLAASRGKDGKTKPYALNTIGAKRKAYYDLREEVSKHEETVREMEGRLAALNAEADAAGVPVEAR